MSAHTPTPWSKRLLFEKPILVQDSENNREWYSNSIDIHDNSGRIICEVKYMTDTQGMGWGNNETIEKFEANAARIVQCVNEHDGLIEQIESLRAERDGLVEALREAVKYVSYLERGKFETTIAKYEK